jgi:hypothetical protein
MLLAVAVALCRTALASAIGGGTDVVFVLFAAKRKF